MSAGVAFSEAGVARAGMGADAADYDGSGRQSLLVGNFSNEMMALYRNEKRHGLFIDDAPRSAIGRATLLTLTFGCFFFDYDPRRPSGHLRRQRPRRRRHREGPVAGDLYRQRPHLRYNTGQGHFGSGDRRRRGPALNVTMVGRGAAYGDFDGDGDLDVAICRQQWARPGCCATTATPPPQTCYGCRSDRHAPPIVTASVRACRSQSAVEPKMWQIVVKTGSSYLSQSEMPLTFGLGPCTTSG